MSSASSLGSLPTAARRSAALHERVQRFAERWERPGLVRDEHADDFDRLALDIAAFQADQSPGFQRLLERSGGSLSSVAAIPAVPTDVFRLTRVAVHPEELDSAVFETSGTTQGETGRHPQRELVTYEKLALILGRQTLFAPLSGPAVVVALAKHPGTPPRSSLGHMMGLFMEHFDGRALTREPQGVPFLASARERWLADPSGIDLAGLIRACKLARQRSEPLVVLATSFALVGLLDALDGEVLPTPERCFVMLTGGFKGRTRELSPSELRSEVARAFHTSEKNLLGEYGMTELTSQLYEAWSGSAVEAPAQDPVRAALEPRLTRFGGHPGVFFAPPWLRVSAVDPATLQELPEGQLGLARFVDLGNVDSAVAVQTEDLVRVENGAIELHGRAPRAPVRGCSLPYEGLLKQGARS